MHEYGHEYGESLCTAPNTGPYETTKSVPHTDP